jgi:hypothetical protein
MHMVSETVTGLSYRESSHRLEGLAKVVIPRSTLHRWMTKEKWEGLRENLHTESMWGGLSGIMADGTGYKRQRGENERRDKGSNGGEEGGR